MVNRFEDELAILRQQQMLTPEEIEKRRLSLELYLKRVQQILVPTFETIQKIFLRDKISEIYVCKGAIYNEAQPISYDNHPTSLALAWNPFTSTVDAFHDQLLVTTPMSSSDFTLEGDYKSKRVVKSDENFQDMVLTMIQQNHTHSSLPFIFRSVGLNPWIPFSSTSLANLNK